MGNEDRKLDELLDNALAEYGNAEPRTGLEGRIIARLATEPETKAWLPWGPAWGLATIAAIALISLVSFRPPQARKPETAVNKTPTAAPPKTSTVSTAKVVTNARPHSVTAPHLNRSSSRSPGTNVPAPRLATAKQELFPAPSPLTDQEKLLFDYLRRTPAEEIVSQAKADPSPQEIDQQNRVLPTRP